MIFFKKQICNFAILQSLRSKLLIISISFKSSGDWDDVRLKVSRADGGKLAGATCGFNEQTQFDLQTVLRKDQKAVFVDKNVCLEKGVVYNVQIDFKSNNGHGNGQTLLDSVSCIFAAT